MRKFIASLGVAAVLAAASGVAVSKPAQGASLFVSINRAGDVYWHEYCGVHYYSEWFWDKASSWENNGTPAEAWNYSGSGGIFYFLWFMPANTQSNWVGSSNNDKADAGYDFC